MRLASPNVFVAGWSRSGTTSLRAGLAKSVPGHLVVGAEGNDGHPGEGLYFKGNGKGSVLLRGDPPVAPGVRGLGAATMIGGPGVGLAPQTLSVYKEAG